MVRPVGGAAGNSSAAPLPAQLFQNLGLTASKQRIRNEVGSMFDSRAYSSFQGLPTSASRGEFSFSDVVTTYEFESSEYYDPKDYDATESANLAGLPLDYEKVAGRKYYDVDDEDDNIVIPGLAGPSGYTTDETPAPLSVVPTSTTNPERPRTVAAGYDKKRQVITVVFRDGTWYNYYDCDPGTWQDFKARVSKGKYIYKYLDFHPRGPADVSAFSADSQEVMYRIVRTAQIHLKGKQMKPSRTPKPGVPTTASKRASGPSRKR